MKIISNTFNGKLNFSGSSITITTSQPNQTFYQHNFSVVAIDRASHRSVGGAIVGGVAVGFLTGGLGAIVGAGFGGRRRGGNIFVVTVPGVGSMAVTEVRPEHEALLMIAATTTAAPTPPKVTQIEPPKRIRKLPSASESMNAFIVEEKNTYVMRARDSHIDNGEFPLKK